MATLGSINLEVHNHLTGKEKSVSQGRFIEDTGSTAEQRTNAIYLVPCFALLLCCFESGVRACKLGIRIGPTWVLGQLRILRKAVPRHRPRTARNRRTVESVISVIDWDLHQTVTQPLERIPP
ncbi:hypothetical protein PCASD_14615 [Puccinia coronata f. sp. avenae]|uniref:Uncharacterized protein n=1 Tax=Puccinia coronata f. sp. avenae TaxID=200324 RepID=A0A2N5TUN3_9BASI|nr:hypothetical protein PCASD_14615 [Puccinia coronata f. sp. avenae]